MLKGGSHFLWRASNMRDLHTDGWEFAVDGDDLCKAGWSDIDFRWLHARGFIDGVETQSSKSHANPIRLPPRRQFECRFHSHRKGVLAAQVRACVAFAPTYRLAMEMVRPSIPNGGWRSKAVGTGAQELRLGIHHQAFSLGGRESGNNPDGVRGEAWPTRIDDPLPQKTNQDPKCRLHDTIKCLNRNHRQP